MPLSKQQLGSLLWGMADTGLRGKVEDYKAYILSLLFFKRLSDNYEWETETRTQQFREQYGKEPNPKQLDRLQEEGHTFTIPPKCFWADVRNAALDDKNERLHEAVNGIAERNPALRGIINSVRWNEPAPDGSGKKRLDPEVVAAAINYLDPIPLDNSNVTPDVLGDAYEYLIKKFADENKAGATAGQFYTPPEVRDIIIRFIQPQPDQTMYDPTCGSGGFLIDGAKFAMSSCGDGKRLRLFGQETIWNTWAIANINMLLHALDGKIEQGNTIKAPKFLTDNGSRIRQFDRVGANFPFSEENWWLNGTPKKDAKGKPILKKNGSPQLEYPDKDEFSDPYERFAYGIPPFSNGDFVFVQHIVASLNDTGRAGIICPQGVLFRGQPAKTEEEDGQNRKADDEYLIRRGFLTGARDKDGNIVGEDTRNLIEAIVVLPDNLFYGTTIPGAIVFFNKNKAKDRADKVLMVYAAREGWYKETPDQNILLPHDVLRILIQLLAWGDIEAARGILPGHKTRLYADIQERLEFEKSEINLRYRDEKLERETLLEKLADNTLNNGDRSKLEKRLARLNEMMDQMQKDLAEADKRAQEEREAVDRVEAELLEMFTNPELRKRYHAIVDLDEIEENEFNLNIPRYVDTFAPEQRIGVGDALRELREARSAELAADDALLSETPDDIGVPCLIADDFENTVCGYHLALIRTKDGFNPSFLSYLFQGEAARRYFLAKAAGLTRFGLNARTIGGLPIPVPPPAEQAAIANVLEAVECAILNARAVIGKADHLQKGVMQQLLTGRLKPDGGLRQRSDFYEGAKLAFVPKGWIECRVRHIATKVTDGDHVTPRRVPKGFYLLSARNVGNGRLLLADVDYVDESELLRIRKRCDPDPGDLLISCSGTIGNACLVPEGMQCTLVRSAALVKFQTKKCNPKFMEWLFRATPMQRQMQVAASVSIQGNLFQGSIRRLWLMLPEDVDEQAEIAAKLNAVQRLISAKEQKIVALQRLKSSLMQNLLTGRIRLPIKSDAEEVTA